MGYLERNKECAVYPEVPEKEGKKGKPKFIHHRKISYGSPNLGGREKEGNRPGK